MGPRTLQGSSRMQKAGRAGPEEAAEGRGRRQDACVLALGRFATGRVVLSWDLGWKVLREKVLLLLLLLQQLSWGRKWEAGDRGARALAQDGVPFTGRPGMGEGPLPYPGSWYSDSALIIH